MLLLAVVATAAQIRVCGEVEEEGEKGFLCGGLYVGSRMLMFAVEVAAMARVGGF